MTTQLAPNSMSLPPPSSPELDLRDGDRVVGWISGRAVGYRGFANENEAAGAAWVAHRTLSRRLARRHGGRPAPIDVEPLGIARHGDHEAILASNRPIATLVRPGVDSRSGSDTFGFEIEVPLPGGELTMRSIAYRIYRTLRRSGVRWAMWNGRPVTTARQAKRRPARSRAPQSRHPVPARHRAAPQRNDDPDEESMRAFRWMALGGVGMALLLLALIVPQELAVGLGAIGLVGLFVFRISAMSGGWLPDVPRPAPRERSRQARQSSVTFS